MAIALDLANATQNSNSSPLTWSHTCTGSNLILWVTVGYATVTTTISSVTYNGVSLTKLNSVSNAITQTVDLWYMIGPPTGANNVSIAFTGGSQVIGISTSYTGTNQSSQPDASAVNGPATATSFTQAVVTVADNCWAIFGGSHNSGSPITAGANTTVRNQAEAILQGTFVCDTNSPKTPAGTDTMTATGDNAIWMGIMASFSPVPPTNIISVSGVAQASIASVSSVTNANIKSVSGVSNT